MPAGLFIVYSIAPIVIKLIKIYSLRIMMTFNIIYWIHSIRYSGLSHSFVLGGSLLSLTLVVVL